MDQIFGSIYGAAVGDAMGAATETRSAEMIREYFGGWVDTLLTPPDDCFAYGCPAGSVTDDFSLAYYTALEIIASGGKVDDSAAKRAVLAWAEHPEYTRFAGPTTMAAIQKMRGEAPEQPQQHSLVLACDNMKATNGSSMKIFPVGLIHPGDPAGAIRDTVTICLPTHANDAAISGACAISCAVAEALRPNATLDSVIGAGAYGARTGLHAAGKAAARLAVPSVEKRIALAVEIGRSGRGWEKTMLELRDIVGSGLAVAESVPCVFGILAANPEDLFSAVKMGVNIGNDTDTVATMVGAVGGALYGPSNLPPRFLPVIEKVNKFDLHALADQLRQIGKNVV